MTPIVEWYSGPDGGAVGRYDRSHVLDVYLGQWREFGVESAVLIGPGEVLKTVDLDVARLGMGIWTISVSAPCFVIWRWQAQDILTAPAAFYPARLAQRLACCCHAPGRIREREPFVIPAAQGGVAWRKVREPMGHFADQSDPWGRVIAEG